MLLTAEPVKAEKALEIGLVGRIIPQEDLVDEAIKLAEKIAENAPLAVRETKKLLREGQFTKLEPHLEACAAAQGKLHCTEDHVEAINAFFEKRTGNFKNK